MPVVLDKKEDEKYGKGNDEFTVTKQKYDDCDLFFIYTHTPKKSSGGTYLTFKKTERSGNENYFFYDGNNLRSVDVYFSNYNDTIPLVLVVNTKGSWYYGFTYLKSIKGWTPISNTNKFNANQLLDKLIEENNNLNKVVTYRLDKRPEDKNYDGVKVEKQNHPSFEKYKHKPLSERSDYTATYLLYNGKSLQIDNLGGYKIDDQLKNFDGKSFCDVFVYFIRLTNSSSDEFPKYLELKENDNKKKYYFEKKGLSYIHWTQIEDPKLDNVISYFLDKKPSNSDTYNEGSIRVTKLSNESFEFYTHKPETNYQGKKGILRYNDKDLELVPNDYLGTEVDRLNNFNDNVYCHISLFYYRKTIQNQKPEFLELIKKGTGHSTSEDQQECTDKSKCYLFQRSDEQGLKWKQIEYQDLKKTITYKLEFKSAGKMYNDSSVTVTKGPKESFDVYTHKPKDPNKLGMFLYNRNTLTLQPNDDSQITNKLDKIQRKKYCKVCVYYSNKHFGEAPLFLELFENTGKDSTCQSQESGGSNSTWLQRVDRNGFNWKQRNKPSDFNNSSSVFTEIILNDKNSIMVSIIQPDYYHMKTIKNFMTNGIGTLADPPKKVEVKEQTIFQSTYKYFEHTFSKSKDLENIKIVGLRVFVSNLEIKFFGTSNKIHLDFDSTRDIDKKFSVYFITNDSVPLLLHYNSQWYGPNKKDEYLSKWKEQNALKNLTPKRNLDPQLKQKLDEINKRLNEIDLSKTKGDGYGIQQPGQKDEKAYYKSHNGKFDGKRIHIKVEKVKEKFLKVLHSSKNKSSIGNVMFGTDELKNDEQKTLSDAFSQDETLKSVTISSVTAFYHLSDQSCEKPLLLRFNASTTGIIDPFYELKEPNNNVNWSKILNTGTFLSESGQQNKINQIHYNFNSSIKIHIEKQISTNSSYKLELVKNGPTTERSEPITESIGNITVSEDSTDCSLESNYKCIKHAIPILSTNPKPSDVGGLRFYLYDNEVTFSNSLANLGKLFIFYNYNNFQGNVQVYFYVKERVIDKVPLLIGYDGKYYGPKSKDDYFNQWVLVDGLSSSSLSQQIITKLDQINKSLNEVNISITKGGSSYGLKKPETGIKGIDDSFCNRINVKQEDQSDFYKKVVHSTINKGPTGQVLLSGNKINGIELSKLGATCNKVEVYYHFSDNGYNKPLLINIKYQNNEIFCDKWYYRDDVEGIKWKNELQSNKYKGPTNIRDQLQLIQSKLSNCLYIQIHQQKTTYQIITKTGTETQEKKHEAEIKIDKHKPCSSYEVDGNYKCFKHELSNYYNENKDQIHSILKTHEKEPTLEMKIEVGGNVLQLTGTDGSPLSSPLTYGPKDARTQNNPFVYFFDNGTFEDDSTDKLPLLFKLSETFFGPANKDEYFRKWKQYNIDTSSSVKIANNIKVALNKITRLLNLVDLEQTTDKKDYGDIKPTQGSDTLHAKPRVTVKRNSGLEYNYVTHSTANTGCVGNVKFGESELKVFEGDGASVGKPWSEAIEQELTTRSLLATIYNDLTAYYHRTDNHCKNPLLIKISGSSGSGIRLQDLYYERHDNQEPPIKWRKVTESLRVNDITDKVNQIFYNFNKSVKIELSNPGQKGYLGKYVQNRDAGSREPGGGVGVNVAKDNCNIGTSYTCIKHTVTMNEGTSSKVGGLRFYFGEKEVETFKNDKTLIKSSIYYDNRRTEVHVYFHSIGETMDTVPLMFMYNKQFYKPLNKTSYFDKWVLDVNVNGRHPNSTQLDAISVMLNEINLENTGKASGASAEQYGLTKPDDAGTLEGFNEKRITVKRDKATSGKFGKVVHKSNNKLPVGKIMYGSKELAENDSPNKTLSEAFKSETSILGISVNAVTAYYHKDDEGFTTPLILGFGRIRDTNAVVEPGSATDANPTVFYKRENRADVRKWTKAGLHDINDQKIASTLEEIRYELGKCIAIYIEKQHKGTGASEEYEVKVVDNKPGTSRSTGPQSISGFNQKIQVKKEDCPNTQSPESPSQPALEGYACYTHTIPDLKTATESQYIGGLKLYVCEKNQLQTFGVGGYLPEPIYYKSEQQTVTVYFYSSGHGPPRGGGDTSDPGTQKPDTVPLLVTYGGKYFSPKDRFTYFTSWDRVDVQESQGDTSAINHIATVLDKINKDLNSVQIDKTGDTDGTSSGYGLYNKDAFCSCSENNFCNRVSAQRDIKNVANYRKVIHSTTNKFRIGDVYHGSQKITAIKTTEVDGCNLLNVYYGPDDKDCKNPLLICLGQQTETNSVSEGTTNTQCKKWFKLKSINVTDWTEVSQEDISKYARDDSIKGELTQILEKFKDYLYLEIDNTSKYQPNVQHQTGDKKKVGDNKDENKIKVEEANGEAGSEETGDGVQVPKDYKGYKHELKDFYNRAKKEINTALKPQSTNLIPDSSGENTNPELQLRLQIAGQIITLVGQDAKTSLSDPPTLKPTDGDSGTTTANDPVVYFYKTGGGTSGGSSPDTVPLLFKFGKKYYRPLNRASYFQTWHQVMITEGESGNSDGLKEKIKNELDRINRELNEIDLTKTRSGTSRETDYGLEIPRGTTLTNSFSTKRIQVERQDKVLSGTTSFTYISHRTANKYNIGNIKQLGECQFDNTHTKTLGDKPIHNEAVAVYDKGDFTYNRPQLVLIAESNSRGSGSTVKGYYDLSNGCASKITFKTVTGGFTVEDLGKREKMIGEKDLLPILQRIGILEKEQPPELLQASALDSSPGHDGSVSQEEGEDGPEEEDSLTGDGDGERDPAEGQDARSKAGVVPGGADGRVGSGGVVAGAKVPMGLSGPTGTRGNDGARGTEHQSTLQTQTETTASSSTHTTTTRSNGHVTQEQSRVDGDNSGSTNGGGTHTQSERGAQTSSGGGGGIFETHKTEIIAGGGGAGGVGVMATVGAVVF